MMAKRALTAALILLTSGVAMAKSDPQVVISAQAEKSERLFAVVYRAGPTWQKDKPMAQQSIVEHAAWIEQKFKDGVIYSAGPFGPDGGLVIFYATDINAALAFVNDDPAVRTGLFVGEVKRYVARFHQDGPMADQR